MSSEPGFTVTHYQFQGWPDHSVPEYAGELLSLLKNVTTCVDKCNNVEGAILVHCRLVSIWGRGTRPFDFAVTALNEHVRGGPVIPW